MTRVVAVKLSAEVQAYNQAMLSASRATATVGTEAEKLAQKKQAFQQLGAAMFLAGGVIAAGVGIAVAKFAEFDQAMSNVIATGEDAAANQDALRQAALDAGAATVFSATESANAIEELAKAGLSAEDILGGGLTGALDLAAAGGLGVAEAAGIAATSMQQFELRGEDASHVADLLAAGAGKAMGDVTDMAGALNQAGLVANQFGLSVEETVGTLAAFANAGMLGSDAGTSMRTMLLRLANPTEEVKDLMADLNIQAYDQQGNFIGLSNLAGVLETSLDGMTQAQRDQTLAMIFGQDAIRGANILLREGKTGIEEWTAAVDDQGYAAQTAATRLDNLNGDIEALGGALDTALISTGSAANDVLRTMVQIVTALIDVYNALPEPMQASVLVISAVAAAVGLVAGAALLAVPKVAEFRAAVDLMGISIGRVALVAGGAAAGIGLVVTIVATLANTHAEAQAKARAYADTLESGTNRITKATRDMVKENLAAKQSGWFVDADSAYDAAEKLGVSLDLVTDAAMGNTTALRELNAQIDLGANGSEKQKKRLDETGLSLTDYALATNDLTKAVAGEGRSLEEATRVSEQKTRVTEEGVGVTKTAAEAYIEAAESAGDLTSQLQTLIETINAANGVGQDAVSANIDYQQALADVDEQIKNVREGAEGYAAGLDITTQAGRDNKDMLVDLAQQAQDAADSQFALDNNTDTYRATLEASRQALIDRAMDLGANADEAAALADQIFRIPSETEWKAIADTAEAAAVIDRFIWANDGRRINLIVDGVAGRQVAGSDVVARANGGIQDYSHAFAGGGAVDTGIYAGRAGGKIKFAEPETIWEAYISGKPDQRSRNIGLWQETGRRLGVGAASAAPINLEGAHVTGTLEIGGDGLGRLVNAQISLYDREQKSAAQRGYAGGI